MNCDINDFIVYRDNNAGPGLFIRVDYNIDGYDGILGRGMQRQGMSFWMTLRYGPDIRRRSPLMPTLPGKLFFIKELSGPLTAECN